MKARLLIPALLAASCWRPGPASAFNQPGLNLGYTSMLDGGPTDPGFYLLEYVRYVDAGRPADQNGDTIPGGAGISGLINLHQLYFLSDRAVLGGLWSGNVVLPVTGLAARGTLGGAPMTANSNGPADLFIGTAIQWNAHRLFGRPLGHLIEIDLGLPTGGYDPALAVNPGSNLVTINPYYSMTWFFAERWETSWQFNYAYHTENARARLQPGQAFHMTYEISRELHPKLRLGAGGYFLQQLTDDKINATPMPDTKERACSIGPVIGYLGRGFIVIASHFIEVDARNRFESVNTTFQIIHKF